MIVVVWAVPGAETEKIRQHECAFVSYQLILLKIIITSVVRLEIIEASKY